MDGDSIKENLDGLSKIDGISDVLYVLIYWVAIAFIILFVGYLFMSFSCYLNKKRGKSTKDRNNFLDD